MSYKYLPLEPSNAGNSLFTEKSTKADGSVEVEPDRGEVKNAVDLFESIPQIKEFGMVIPPLKQDHLMTWVAIDPTLHLLQPLHTKARVEFRPSAKVWRGSSHRERRWFVSAAVLQHDVSRATW